MKKCPTCNAVYNAVYADKEENFCFYDRSLLIEADEQETVVMQSKPQPASSPQVIKQGVSPFFAYLAVGLMALLIGGGIVAWLVSRDYLGKNEDKPENTSQKLTEDVKKPQGSESKDEISSKAQMAPVQNIEAAPLTIETVRTVLDNWQSAQNGRNFLSYKDCYDVSFRGIKRTVNGSVSYYNYSQWINDRKKMISKAKYMRVRIDKLQISINDDIAAAEFEQYFSTNGYGDFGPKVIRFKMTNSGPKIIYEELKSSTLLTD